MSTPGHADEQPRQRVDDDLPGRGVDAGECRRLLVAADRVGVAPEDRLVQQDRGDDGQQGQDEHGVGQVQTGHDVPVEILV
jgi:hypothetical protein